MTGIWMDGKVQVITFGPAWQLGRFLAAMLGAVHSEPLCCRSALAPAACRTVSWWQVEKGLALLSVHAALSQHWSSLTV